MTKNQILVVHTGGTIGMIPGPAGLVPDKQFAGTLSRWINQERPELRFSIKCVEPLIDSADAAPSHWYSIAKTILDSHSNFSGIVVFHGTDTLAYTASALSFILKGVAKPIILTGAQIPLFAANSDARSNIHGALTSALDGRVREVCIFFDGTLLRGNRSVKFSTETGDSFASPHWPALANFARHLEIDQAALLNPTPTEPHLPPRPMQAGSVGLVKVYPGLSDRILLAAAEIHSQGIILELYGSGTAPALNSSLQSALRKLAHQKIPIVGVSQCVRGAVTQPLYESSYVLREAGVIAGHDLTAEAALTKLGYLHSVGCPPEDLEAAIANTIAGEITNRSK